LLAVSAVGGAWLYILGGVGGRPDLITHTVRRENLQLTIVERGALEAAQNADINVRVKARSQGSTNATTIKWIIDDGSHVMANRPEHLRNGVLGDWVWPHNNEIPYALRGKPLTDEEKKDPEIKARFDKVKVWSDLLVELDASGLEEQLKTKQIEVETARAAWIKADEDYKIQLSQNESDLQTALTTLTIAEIDLNKYVEGDYPQLRKEIEGRILIARSDLEMWRDRVQWSERMVKGTYITAAQEAADKARARSAEINVLKVEEELKVLQNYTLPRERKDKQSKVDEAKRNLDRVEKQNAAKEATTKAEAKAKKSIYDQEMKRMKDIDDQIKECLIYAPQDGLVVYHVDERSRFGMGSRQSMVAQGEPVSEGQRLIRIPDLRRMLVNTKVHEAMISRVKAGQPGRIRVDAYPDRDLTGQIKSVATVASQQDWMSADVKVYQTMVSIDEEVQGLKPGMSAEVTILTDTEAENAITVPVQAILGSIDMGRKRKCFVLTARGPEERDVVVGISNDKMVEIREGLQEGEQVVLNPRVLLDEKSNLKPARPGRKEGSAEDDKGPDSGGRDNGAATPGDGKGKAGPGAGLNGPGAGGFNGPGGPGAGVPGGPGGPGMGIPGGGLGGPGAAPPGGGGQPGKPRGSGGPGAGGRSPEERQKAMEERMKNATPEERRRMEEMRQRFQNATPEERQRMIEQFRNANPGGSN
jgi:multidrug resistance efflux pump